jgi:hypothetical protein
MAAMRQWQVIPNALLSDNGSPFKGTLIQRYCQLNFSQSCSKTVREGVALASLHYAAIKVPVISCQLWNRWIIAAR